MSGEVKRIRSKDFQSKIWGKIVVSVIVFDWDDGVFEYAVLVECDLQLVGFPDDKVDSMGEFARLSGDGLAIILECFSGIDLAQAEYEVDCCLRAGISYRDSPGEIPMV